MLTARAVTREQLETVRRELDALLIGAGCSAQVTVTHQRLGASEREIVAGPYHAPRARHGGRLHDNRLGPWLSPAVRRRWLLASLIAAVGGASCYVAAPGVASTQIGLPLTLPLIFAALIWMHRRLLLALQWVLAVSLALGGSAAYVIVGGTQLWAWGQLTTLPLVGLILDRALRRGTVLRTTTWYGGPRQGPYGPP